MLPVRYSLLRWQDEKSPGMVLQVCNGGYKESPTSTSLPFSRRCPGSPRLRSMQCISTSCCSPCRHRHFCVASSSLASQRSARWLVVSGASARSSDKDFRWWLAPGFHNKVHNLSRLIIPFSDTFWALDLRSVCANTQIRTSVQSPKEKMFT